MLLRKASIVLILKTWETQWRSLQLLCWRACDVSNRQAPSRGGGDVVPRPPTLPLPSRNITPWTGSSISVHIHGGRLCSGAGPRRQISATEPAVTVKLIRSHRPYDDSSHWMEPFPPPSFRRSAGELY